MNKLKKGFTLIELLGVIIVLSILMLLVVPPLLNSVNKNKESVSSANEKLIYSATDLYISNHSSSFPKYNGSTYCVTIGSLVSEDLLDDKIYKVETSNSIDSTKTVKIDVNNYTYNMSIVDANECTYAMATPNVDFNLETIGGEKFIVIDTYGDGPNISRITTSSGDNVPKYSKKLKIYVSGYKNNDGTDATQYASFLTENGYENEVHIDNKYPTVEYLLNNGFNTIVINRYVWSIEEVVNSYFAAGINVITTGNDSSSILTPIDSSIGSASFTNKQGNYRPIVDNNFSKRLGNLTSATTDSRNIITFIPEVEVLYSETVDGQVYDAVGGYTANDTKWVHCQVSLSPSMMEKYTLGSLEYIANKDLYYYKVVRPGTYLFRIYDESGVSREVSYEANDVWVWDFYYTGGMQEFTAPMAGKYKLEVWGSQGSVSSWGGASGYGGYATGTINLSKNKKLYIYDGGVTGYNGGGSANSGGGATHIANVNRGTLSSYQTHLSELLIVAGGAGGGERELGGSGGGYIGVSGSQLSGTHPIYATGGTQTSGGTGKIYSADYPASGQINGTFGQGGSGINATDSGAGGGGGYYGGGGTTVAGGGGGGSGYIGNGLLTSKSMYCYGCQEATNSATDKNIFTVSTTGSNSLKDSVNCPTGYSANPVSKCAKAGNGHARITYINDENAITITYDYNYLPNDIYETQYNTKTFNACCAQNNGGTGSVASKGVLMDQYGVTYYQTGTNGWYFGLGSNGPLTLNTEYTLLFDAKGSENFNASIGTEQTNYKSFAITTDWKRYSHTFNVSNPFTTTEGYYRAFVFYNWYKSDANRTLNVRNIQLQQGTLYTKQQVYIKSEKIGNLEQPTRTDWVFDGWYTDPIGGTKITSNTRVPSENTTYYAHWTKNVWKFSGKTQNTSYGTVSVPSSGKYRTGTSMTVSATPKDGYVFSGWYDQNDRQVSTDATYTFTMPYSDLELTATFSFEITKISNIKVLNVYPYEPQAETFKGWMTTYGQGRIDVTPVYLDTFNANPSTYLGTSNNWNYDVVVFGFRDCNASKDISASASTLIGQYIDQGHGVIFGHDTITAQGCGNHVNFNALAPKVNLELSTRSYTSSDKIKITREGIFTSYPYNIGGVGTELTIPTTHVYGQTANGDIWLQLTKDSVQDNRNFYLTTYQNTAMIQTGHSNGSATDDEQKILANIIFYLYSYDLMNR